MLINEEYKIESDDLNFILMKRFSKKQKEGDKDKPIEYDFRAVGFYPTIQKALVDLTRKEIRGDGFKDFTDICNKIEELENTIKNLKL